MEVTVRDSRVARHEPSPRHGTSFVKATTPVTLHIDSASIMRRESTGCHERGSVIIAALPLTLLTVNDAAPREPFAQKSARRERSISCVDSSRVALHAAPPRTIDL